MVAAKPSMLENMRREGIQPGSRIEIILRSDAELCNDDPGGVDFFSGGTAETPGIKYAGYVANFDKRFVHLAHAWEAGRPARLGGIRIYEESILSYNV